MKKIISVILAAVLSLSLIALTACGGSGSDTIKIAVPNDTTNEARALLLLQDLGYITLDENAGITATIKDITENPYNLSFKEVEAAQIPSMDIEMVKKYLQADQVKDQLISQKAVAVVVDSATATKPEKKAAKKSTKKTEETAEGEEKPAKKPAAKKKTTKKAEEAPAEKDAE